MDRMASDCAIQQTHHGTRYLPNLERCFEGDQPITFSGQFHCLGTIVPQAACVHRQVLSQGWKGRFLDVAVQHKPSERKTQPQKPHAGGGGGIFGNDAIPPANSTQGCLLSQ